MAFASWKMRKPVKYRDAKAGKVKEQPHQTMKSHLCYCSGGMAFASWETRKPVKCRDAKAGKVKEQIGWQIASFYRDRADKFANDTRKRVVSGRMPATEIKMSLKTIEELKDIHATSTGEKSIDMLVGKYQNSRLDFHFDIQHNTAWQQPINKENRSAKTMALQRKTAAEASVKVGSEISYSSNSAKESDAEAVAKTTEMIEENEEMEMEIEPSAWSTSSANPSRSDFAEEEPERFQQLLSSEGTMIDSLTLGKRAIPTTPISRSKGYNIATAAHEITTATTSDPNTKAFLLPQCAQVDEMAAGVSATTCPRSGHSEEEAEISNNAPSSAGTEGKTATETSRGAKGYVTIAADTKGESEISGTDIGDKDTSQTQGRSSSPESKGHSASPKIEGHPMSVEPKLKVEISVHRMVHQILEFLGDDKTRTIGLYGQGGIGKTFILKALIKVLEADPQFDIIIWANLSRNWSTRNIQNAVLRQLELGQAHLETDEVIAKRLFQALEKKKFLLIVDDVWERIDFDRVGIPVDKGKLIVSTTSSDVCRDMAENAAIEVGALTMEDSWELFREHVGEMVDDPNVRSTAQSIVDDCGGLPLLIVATGKALADESSVDEWSHTLKEFILLKPLDGHEALLQKLKISYQRLKVHGRKSPRLRDCDIQTCFLYCALFQEDYREINISELVNYWFQEGLIGVILKDASKKGHDVIEVLTSRALIERTQNGSGIKMHEVMRDLASGILSEVANDCQFLVRASGNVDVGQSDSPPRSIGSEKSLKLSSPEIHRCLFKAAAELTKPPPEREWEPANLIFLMDNKLSSLPEKPNCPQLSNLFLQRNPNLRKIPMLFFERMPYLKVLNLSKTSINSIPKSISKLASLQCLNLRGCIRLFKLPPEVGELNHLQLLLLFGTFINQLPEQIGKLSSLKELEVSFYGPVDYSEYSMLPPELIPPGVIAKLLSLKNLSIDVQPGDLRWKKNSSSVMKEMFNLDNLTGLSFYAPEGNDLQLHLLESLLWKEERLRKFNFVVGHDVKRLLVRVPQEVELKYNQQDRCLRFVNAKTVPEEIKAVLTRTTAFYLDHNLEVRSLSEFGVENINGLKFCILRECPEIETIVDGEEGAMPWLEHLSIHYLEKLEMIWKNPVPSGSFGNLRYLQVSTCLRLNFVMTRSTSFRLHSLVEIVVEDCQAIKEIIHEDSGVEPEIVVLPVLERLTLRHLPNLVSICKWPLGRLQMLGIYFCEGLFCLPDVIGSLTTLVTLNIIDCPDLERRCEKDKGEDWQKIAHIPSIRINQIQIQG